jgi:hypothetical protein
MPLEAGLIGFAGLASLAMARNKQGPSPLPVTAPPRLCRLIGWGLLLLSAAAAVVRFGFGFGIVAWIGQLCVAGVAAALLLSCAPRLTLALAGAALATAAALLIFYSVTH